MLLRPGTIVIYDDLEADHPADWSWLIHSARRLTANSKLNRLRTNEKTARSQVNFLGSSQLKLAIAMEVQSWQLTAQVQNWAQRDLDLGKVNHYSQSGLAKRW